MNRLTVKKEYGLILLLLVLARPLCAQILLKPDAKATFQRSKGIIVAVSDLKGAYSFNNYFLVESRGHDTIWFINVEPKKYHIEFESAQGIKALEVKVSPGKVVGISAASDSLRKVQSQQEWNRTANKAAGRHYYFAFRNKMYSITQVTLLKLCFSGEMNEVTGFNSFSTVNGYQIAPGFCIGLGVSYNYYDIDYNFFTENNSYPYNYAIHEGAFNNVSFLPLFADFRFHLSSRRAAPYFNFDIGYNTLLSKKQTKRSGNPDPTFVEMHSGGLYLATGIGFRVFISELVQVTLAVEYSYERSDYSGGSSYTFNNPVYDVNLNFINFKIGLGLQY